MRLIAPKRARQLIDTALDHGWSVRVDTRSGYAGPWLEVEAAYRIDDNRTARVSATWHTRTGALRYMHGLIDKRRNGSVAALEAHIRATTQDAS